MAKLTLTDIASGYKAKETLNENNAAIEAAIENTLSRDGSSPNQMESQLDMNSNRVINLPVAVSNSEPITLGQFMSYSGLDYDTVATNNVYLKETAVATANQTIFNLSMSYTPGANTLLVYVNGAQQILSLDYNETNSTRVTFTQGLIAGDNVVFHLWQSATVTGSAPPYYARTAAEVAAGVTPTSYSYPEMHLYRYGTNTTPGTTDMTSAITAAMSVGVQKSGGGRIEMPLDAVAYDGTISFSQGVGMGSAGSAYKGCKLIPLSASAKFIVDTQCLLENLWLYDAATRSGGVGIQLGRAGNFEAFSSLRNVKVEGFEQGLLFENAYFIDVVNCEVKGGTYGITLNPSSGSGLGFQTTITLRKVYVHNCTSQGVRDLNLINPQQMHWFDVVVEHCCPEQTAIAQVELGSALEFCWDGGFIETQSTVTTKPPAIKARTGVFRNLYIDTAYDGLDFGATSCNAVIENVHTANIGRYSINATSGANGTLRMKRVTFATAPNLSIGDWSMERCDGTLPSGVESGSFEFGGTTPKFGVGALSSSKIRAIKYQSYTENITAAANTTTEGTAVNIGSGWVATTSGWVVQASSQSALPTGVIMGGIHRSDNDNVKVRWANVTGTPQSVTNTINVVFIRFAP